MSNDSVWAVVPAAGTGSRMQATRPKQYLNLEGQTVLEHTLQRLASHPRINGIMIVIAKDDPWWPTLTVDIACPLKVTTGGKHRADSVQNALKALVEITDDDPWVLVHDAVRPCLRHQDLDRMLTTLATHAVGGILGISVNDTVKRVNAENEITDTICRQGLWRAVTPQMFRLQALKHALHAAQKQQLTVTDEASAMQLAGFIPMMVEGHADNIKITMAQDLALARLFLHQQCGEI